MSSLQEKIDSKHHDQEGEQGKMASESPIDVQIGGVDTVEKSDLPKDAEAGSATDHVFSDPAAAAYWRDVYEQAKYESRHRFDPNATWSPRREVLLKRKLDWRIMVWVWVMFSSLDLVRRNINRAVSDNLLGDLNLNTNDYNNGQTIFLASFLAAELPAGLISKKLGPDRVVPTSIILWGVSCMCQAAMTGKTSFYILRSLTGLFQGGFIPEMVLYLSYFYKGTELPIRLSIFWTAIPLTQIYGSFLAVGFLSLRGVQGWAGWQWIFLLEGLICVIVGLLSYGMMPASVTQPALFFRHKDGSNKWWTAEDEKILVNRVLRDDPTKGDMNNRQAVNLRGIWAALTNVDLWPVYILGVTAYIPFQPISNYLSLTLRNLGFSVVDSNLLAIPGYVLFVLNTLLAGWLSEKLNERSLVASYSNVWMLPFFISLATIPVNSSPWVRYTLLSGVNGIPYTHAILVAMTSRNAKSVGTRAVSTAVYNMCYQVGSIIAVNVYRQSDAPYYYTANKALAILCGGNICIFVLMKVFYIWRNKQKRRQLDAMSSEQRTLLEPIYFYAH